MPVINIQFDDATVNEAEMLSLSNAIQRIVSEATDIEDVFVYGNSAKIKVKIAPIEIFVQLSDHKIKDVDALVAELRSKLSAWKKENNYPHLINLTFIPMHWKIEIGI